VTVACHGTHLGHLPAEPRCTLPQTAHRRPNQIGRPAGAPCRARRRPNFPLHPPMPDTAPPSVSSAGRIPFPPRKQYYADAAATYPLSFYPIVGAILTDPAARHFPDRVVLGRTTPPRRVQVEVAVHRCRVPRLPFPLSPPFSPDSGYIYPARGAAPWKSHPSIRAARPQPVDCQAKETSRFLASRRHRSRSWPWTRSLLSRS
jgi:hypothetical protein